MQKPERVWAIGDIHNDLRGLTETMLNMFDDGMDLETDLLVFIGDYIDGYKDGKETVAFIRSLQKTHPENVIALRGNHEELCSDAAREPFSSPFFQVWWQQGGEATYRSYLDDPNESTRSLLADGGIMFPKQLSEDVEWFRSLPLWHETDHFIFVHAGLREPLPPEANDPHDLLWIRKEFHTSNYDWNGKRVVYGHTARKEPLVEKNKIGIDTRWRGKGYVTGCQLFADRDPIFYKPSDDIVGEINKEYK